MSRLRGQGGFAIIENLVSLVIILMATGALMSAIMVYRRVAHSVETQSSQEKQVLQIIENVRTGLENYQISFAVGDAERDRLLASSKLPMAWDAEIVTAKENCPGCPGRFGYVVQPFEGMRGLYLVTMRMTHKDWDIPKDYEFVVSAK